MLAVIGRLILAAAYWNDASWVIGLRKSVSAQNIGPLPFAQRGTASLLLGWLKRGNRVFRIACALPA